MTVTAPNHGSVASIDTLPFPRQRELIVAAAEARDPERIAALLSKLARLPDHEPFTLLVAIVAERSLLDVPAVRAALALALATLDDVALQRVLRSLERGALPASQIDVVVDLVTDLARTSSLERAGVICLVDRWLKNSSPEARRALVRRAEDAVVADAPTPDLEDATLLLLDGPALTRLAARPAWRERLDAFATRLMAILASAPKSLSQANAEELLARQVYTAPGHFLFELLQNAEDAGAERWRVGLYDDRVEVWHDGRDFDGRDVVGLTSIGQSTKGKAEIGFFGVGFKSVFEICDRPQVYSGLFHFELADFSRPRRLGSRPDGAREDGTLLVLPLARREEPFAPETGWRVATSIPAETLLTLDSVREIQVTWGDRRHGLTRRPAGGPSREILEWGAADRRKTYLVERATSEYDGPRDARRAAASPIMVGVALDDEERPVAPAHDEPTIFSYLPTAERSGLRFVLHAHFDLPVDRERLDLASTWNRWALSRAGEILARAVRRLADEHAALDTARTRAALERMLDVLPHPAELTDPAYRHVLEALRERLSDVACLVDPRGTPRSPREAALVEDEAVAVALTGRAVTADGRRPVHAGSARARDVALALGAEIFDPASGIELIAREAKLGPPRWLTGALPALLEWLGRAGAPVDRLREIPFLLDQQGVARRPTELGRASDPALRRLFAVTRRMAAVASRDRHEVVSDLLDRVGVRRLGVGDLLEDLRDPDKAAAYSALDGGVTLHGVLDRLDDEALAPLAGLPLFRDQGGVAGALHREGDPPDRGLWLPPTPELTALLDRAPRSRLRLLDARSSTVFPRLLQRLGARTLTADEVARAVEAGVVELTREGLVALHQALDAARHERSPRDAARLARAAIWPLDSSSAPLRPLVGDGRALVPADDEIRALLTSPRWLAREIAEVHPPADLPGVAPVGAETVARTLLGAEDDPPFDPADEEALEGARAVLVRAGDQIPRRIATALAERPIWRARGSRALQALTDLRWPPEAPPLSSFYDAWGRVAFIEQGPRSAGELASALGLDQIPRRTGYAEMIEDLASGSGLDGVPRDLIAEAILAAAAELPRRTLRRLRDAKIFETEDGGAARLRRWDEDDPEACSRASGLLRDVLAMGSRPLLSHAAERTLAPVLDHLDAPPAGAVDLVAALESDPALATDAARDAARGALARHAREVALAFAASTDGASCPRLQALPIWPARDGRRLPAGALVRPDAFGRIPCDGVESLFGDVEDLAVLDDAARDDADALRGLVEFRDALDLLVEAVRMSARVGAPLEAQRPALGTVEALIELTAELARRLPAPADVLELPLVLDATGLLRAGLHHRAAPSEHLLATCLSGLPPLADDEWAARAAEVAPELAPPLSARRVVSAIAEASRSGDLFATNAGARRALYAWLDERGHDLAADGEARRLFGRLPVIPTRDGALEAPKELLFDDAVPDLAQSWTVAGEVPVEIARWLRSTYRLDAERTHHLVDRVLDAHRDACRAGDERRAVELLTFLATFLEERAGAGGLPALVRRLRLHRRLKIPTDAGTLERPGRLTTADADRRSLIEAFLTDPPAAPAPTFRGPSLRRLLIAAGASPDLPAETLLAVVARGARARPEPASRIALARYLALRVLDDPRARHELELDRHRWIPSADGELRRPSELFWPTAKTRRLLGDRPDLYPAEDLTTTIPAGLAEALPFRTQAEIELDDIVTNLAACRDPVDDDVLDWLEESLRDRRATPARVRDATRAVVRILDDRGDVRSPVELVPAGAAELFGRRRGTWREAPRWPRLASAWQVTKTRRVDREITRVWEEIARDVAEIGAETLLAEEPELRATLPRMLARQVRAGLDLPVGAPLLCRDGDDRPTIALLGDPRLILDDPTELATPEVLRAAALLSPRLPPEDDERILAALRRAGVDDLWSAWRPQIASAAPGSDEPSRERAARLTETLATLWPRLPAVGITPRRAPPPVVAVRRLIVSGEVAGCPATVRMPCVVSPEAGELLVEERALWDHGALASELYRAALSCPREARQLLVDLLVEATTNGSAEELLHALERHAAPREAGAEPERGDGAAPREEEPAAPAGPREPAAIPRRTASDERGVLGRLRDWLRGPPSEERALASPPPRAAGREARRGRGSRRERPPRPPREEAASAIAPSSHGDWFHPHEEVVSQLYASPGWVGDRHRPPDFGFSCAPARLPLPWRYAAKLITSRFEQRSQRWKPGPLDPEWARPADDDAGELRLEGRLPRGRCVLPVPLYSRVRSVEALIDGLDPRLLAARDGRRLLALRAPGEIRVEVSLGAAPNVEAGGDEPLGTPPELLAHTVEDDELPEELLDAIETHRDEPPLERVRALRDLLRARYRYDATYLEEAEVAAWLRRISAGRSNVHIAALHAGRDGRSLGRGVCYELNALLCELLRRAGVPAAVATGWTLVDGTLAEPDHLWVMALLPTPAGPRWWPADAATTRDGRPRQLPRRPAGPWRARSPARVPRGEVEPRRSNRSRRSRRRPPPAAPPSSALSRRDRAQRPLTARPLPVAELITLARHLEAVTGEPLGSAKSLRKRFELLLRDPERVEALLALLRR